MKPRTLYHVLRETVQSQKDAAALHQPEGSGTSRKTRVYTWNEYLQAVEEIAAGLYTLGLRPGDVVALNSETRAEFYLADQGIMAMGGIAAALYGSYPPPDLLQTIANAGARVLFVEDAKTLVPMRGAAVEHFILLTGEAEGALSLDQLRAKGREAMNSDRELLARITGAVTPEHDAILYLTSGATGEPKMVMVKHGAVVANLDMGPSALPLGPQDSTVAFLPAAHIAQRVVVELLPMRLGTPVFFPESLLKLPQELKAVQPTFFLAPPRLWERIYTTICTEIRKRPPSAQKLYHGALGLSLKAAELKQAGKTVPLWMRLPLKLADKIVFSKIREKLGGRLRIAISGAAPLARDLAAFYEAIGVPLTEGYGLTEGGVLCFNPLGAARFGSIGRVLPGVEFRVAEDGELLVHAPCMFDRYHKDEKSTAEVKRNGWLHTGDVAHIDGEGFVYITGRKKEMIVSSTGKKIFPARIESFFKTEPLISQVLLVGDRLPYVTALLTVNPQAAESLDGMAAWKGKSASDLAEAAPVLKEIQRIIRRVNAQLAPFEQIRKHRILERDFTIENGELTATMKVRRTKVLENFRSHIDELYAGRESGVSAE